MQTGERIIAFDGQFLQCRHDRFVAADDQEFLCRIAPPPVGVGEVPDQLSRLFVEHMRRGVRLGTIVDQPEDAAGVDMLVKPVLEDLRAEERAFLGPVRFLDDAVVHVADVQVSVGPGRASRPAGSWRRWMP